MLITEALAELKTLAKRIEKKKEYVNGFLFRQDGLKDPLAKDGGSVEVICRELQAIADLQKRIVQIRIAILQTNLMTLLTVEGVTKSITEWLTWRREISDDQVRFVNSLRKSVQAARTQAQSKGVTVVTPGAAASNSSDLLVNVDEAALARQAEILETILGTLDGQLSLKNATIAVIGLE